MKHADEPQTLQLLPPANMLVVDVASDSWEIKEIEASLRKEYAGGRALALALWQKHAGPSVQSPASYEADNPIVIAGTPLSDGGNTWSIATRSATTGRIAVASSCTRFGHVMQENNLVAIVVVGRARRPVVLSFRDGNLSIENSERMMGFKTTRVCQALSQGNGDSILAIGPAGESHVPYASVVCEGTSIGRGGIGTVFGFKNIKAIVMGAEANAEPVIVDHAQRTEAVKLSKACDASDTIKAMRMYGDVSKVEDVVACNALPILNYTLAKDPRSFYFGGPELTRRCGDSRNPCISCPAACNRSMTDESSALQTLCPSASAMMMLGANLGMFDAQRALALETACIETGLDPVSLGNIMGWAIAARQRGILNTIPDIRRATTDEMVRLIDSIAYRKGSGEELGLGLNALVARVGGADIARMVDSLELGPIDPRGSYGQGILSAMGSDIQLPGILLSALTSKASVRSIAAWTIYWEELSAALQSLGFCPSLAVPALLEGTCGNILMRNKTLRKWLLHHGTHPQFLAPPKIFGDLVKAAYGGTCTAADIMTLGHRCWALQMEIDAQLGHDMEGGGSLPQFFEIMPQGNVPDGQVIPIRKLLLAYWQLRQAQ